MTLLWRLVKSPPLSGRDNMRYDADLLDGVERGTRPPTLRFFRFKDPAVTFGRLQKPADVRPLVPSGWEYAQRPTGGGIVFHKNDLCLSLCWKDSHPPLPKRPQDQYRWIHGIILEALREEGGLHMAACCDVKESKEPFLKRACFTNPVGYDLMQKEEKVVGGALRCTRRATLYQGAIHLPLSTAQEERLISVFQIRLAAGS